MKTWMKTCATVWWLAFGVALTGVSAGILLIPAWLVEIVRRNLHLFSWDDTWSRALQDWGLLLAGLVVLRLVAVRIYRIWTEEKSERIISR